MEKFPNKFGTNFDDNKRLVDQLTQGTTTRVRNKTAGYITRTIALSKAQNADDDVDIEEVAE